MNRNVMMIAILVVFLASVSGLVLLGLNPYFLNPPRLFEVSDMELTYVHGIADYPQAAVNLSVTNLHDSYIRSVDVAINGTDYGASILLVNPGETQGTSIALNNLTLSSSETYYVKLAFAFADGQSQTCLGSCTMKKNATITSISLTTYFDGNRIIGIFELDFQNTGNLPIIEANCVFWTFDPLVSSYFVLPGERLRFNSYYLVHSLSVYPVTVQLKYLDGSNSTINASVAPHSYY